MTNAATVIAGMIFSSAFTKTLYDEHIWNFFPFEEDSTSSPMIHLIVSGFAVGLGTYWAGGCTAGHGLTGLPRLSKRSILSVIIFATVAALSVTYNIQRYLPSGRGKKELPLPTNIDSLYYVYLSLLIPFFNFVYATNKSFRGLIESLMLFVTGIVYGLGLMISGMTLRYKVFNLLRVTDENRDPSMIFIYIIAIFGNFLTFNYMIRGKYIIFLFQGKNLCLVLKLMNRKNQSHSA